MPSHLEFDELETRRDRRTKVWAVRSKHTGAVLGVVKWRASWRRYGVEFSDVFFDADCLIELAEFLRARMAEHCRDPARARTAKF